MPRSSATASISFRAPQNQIKRLDSLAKRQRRDRTQLIGEALEQYLELQDVHLARIEEGIKADERGDYASDQEVEAEFARWRKL
ncbi:MAG: ribbon-helix-helix protein, CopG family [Acidobacteriaceae bacterium]